MSAVDEYLEHVEPEQRKELERIRAIVMQAVPDAEDGASYSMPTFKYRGRPLLGFTARQNHLSVHPFSPAVVESVRDGLQPSQVSKGTIRFTPGNPLPEPIVRKLIANRLEEIDAASTRG